jgi:3-hydroxyisobutyrate dehydrogenase-like beta-hydroxyacid dehydrogenase
VARLPSSGGAGDRPFYIHQRLLQREGSQTFAVLGLGEAGSLIAADLAGTGATVTGWDPARPEAPDGVSRAATGIDAVRGAEAVLSVNSAAAALGAARSVAGALAPGAVFADLNTTAPALKRAVAEAVAESGALFADVALLRPVPGRGIRTPALVSGGGADRFAALLGGYGMPVTPVGREPGAASARKLARSVFTKGQAAAIGEALAAAERLGVRAWLEEDIERTLTDADGAFLRRAVEGSLRHAPRRVDEMEAAVAMLEELGVEPRVASATRAWLEALASERAGR